MIESEEEERKTSSEERQSERRQTSDEEGQNEESKHDNEHKEGNDEKLEQIDVEHNSQEEEHVGSPHSSEHDGNEAQNSEGTEHYCHEESRDRKEQGSPQGDIQGGNQYTYDEKQEIP